MLKPANSRRGRASLVSAFALGAALIGAPQARADAAAPATAAAKAAPAKDGAATADPEIDVSALRYYWASGQTSRMEAEMKRLERLYPHWTPPSFLDEKPSGVASGGEEELDLWDLFAADKLDELDKAIAQRRADTPGWEPSGELRAKLAAKKFRVWINGEAKAGRYADIVRRLDATNPTLEGVDLDVLWSIAEAYQKSRRSDAARAVYENILRTETNPEKRLATVQKALGGLRMADFEQLLALAQNGADGKSEFASLNNDIVRARIAAFLHDEREAPVQDADLKVFADYARAAKDPNQPALLAWYYYKLRNYPQSLEWFKLGLTRGGDAMVAHGLALTLRFLGMKREAEEVAYAWRVPLVNNSILFIDTLESDLTKALPAFVEPERIARYAEVTSQTASGEGAQALGWYAYNTCQYDVAAQWFARSVAWLPKEQSVYGLALSLRKIKKTKESNELINRYDGLFPVVVGLLFPEDNGSHTQTPCEQQRDTAQRRPVARASTMLDARAGFAPSKPRGEALTSAGFGRVASPDAIDVNGAPGGGMPKIPRDAFPIAVDGANPLRFAPAGQAQLVNTAVGADAPAQPGGYAVDPASPVAPLVARRVLGVGPMPYERFGYRLLPAYNGVATASASGEPAAPAGTIWARERAHEPPANDTAAPAANLGLSAPAAYGNTPSAGYGAPQPGAYGTTAPAGYGSPPPAAFGAPTAPQPRMDFSPRTGAGQG